jgi:5-methylcytosine-specific restriction protein A
MTRAYLLTWNSLRWPWPELAQEAHRVAAGETVTSRWGCGRNTHIQPGDRLFLLKQGTEPRGIFASGTAVSFPFTAPHWDEEKAALGVPANYVELQFDVLLVPEDAILRRDLLKGHPVLGQQYWDTQVSGTTIKTAVLPELEQLWQGLAND